METKIKELSLFAIKCPICEKSSVRFYTNATGKMSYKCACCGRYIFVDIDKRLAYKK